MWFALVWGGMNVVWGSLGCFGVFQWTGASLSYGNKTVHRQDNSPTRILKTVHRQI